MKKAVILAVVILASLTHAEQFDLLDIESGQLYGPFSYIDGTIISIDGQSLVLEKIQSKADLLEEKLKSIIIPAIEFREANLMDVINFLFEESISQDPDGTGANILLSRCLQETEPFNNQQENPTNIANIDFWDDVTPTDLPPTQNVPPSISLNLQKISLYDTISLVTELAGLDFVIDERGLVILNKKGEIFSIMEK